MILRTLNCVYNLFCSVYETAGRLGLKSLRRAEFEKVHERGYACLPVDSSVDRLRVQGDTDLALTRGVSIGIASC